MLQATFHFLPITQLGALDTWGKRKKGSTLIQALGWIFLPLVEGSVCDFFYFYYPEESALSVFSPHQMQTHFVDPVELISCGRELLGNHTVRESVSLTKKTRDCIRRPQTFAPGGQRSLCESNKRR